MTNFSSYLIYVGLNYIVQCKTVCTSIKMSKRCNTLKVACEHCKKDL